MKKLLTLLFLIPVLAFGQNRTINDAGGYTRVMNGSTPLDSLAKTNGVGTTGDIPVYNSSIKRFIFTPQSSIVPTISFGTFGSTPNANGGSYSGGVITLQPASASFPGGVTTGDQSFEGVKGLYKGLITAGTVNGSSRAPVTIARTTAGIEIQGDGAVGGEISIYNVDKTTEVAGVVLMHKDDTGTPRHVGSFSSTFVDPASGGYSMLHVSSPWNNEINQENDIGIFGGHGIALWAPDRTSASAPGYHVFKVNGAQTVTGNLTASALIASGAILTNVTGVTPGTDSLLSKNATTNIITKIPASYYATASSLSGYVTTDQTSPQTIGSTGSRLTKLWATDITATNAITGSVTGNAGTATTLANTRTIWGQNFNGSANVTGAASGMTTLGLSGAITSSVGNNANILTNSGATTGYQAFDISNTSGRGILAIQGSTSALMTNGTAYSTILETANATPLELGTNLTRGFYMHPTTQAVTLSGQLGIGGVDNSVTSGTYTPAGTAGTNTANITGIISHYTRIGNEVTVDGSATIDITLGATASDFLLTLPVASNFAATTDLSGFSSMSATLGNSFSNVADTSADKAKITFRSVGTGTTQPIFFHFTYTIL